MKRCLSIKSNRFEFETEQLSMAVNPSNNIKIIEIPIKTIYMEGNSNTSFRPWVDSFKIYFVLLRYATSSILTVITDFIVFLLALQFGYGVFMANILARTASIGVQFTLLNKVVFLTNFKWSRFILFVVYVYLMGIVSILLQTNLTSISNFSVLSSKVLVESLMFFVNFSFLRVYLFNSNTSQ